MVHDRLLRDVGNPYPDGDAPSEHGRFGAVERGPVVVRVPRPRHDGSPAGSAVSGVSAADRLARLGVEVVHPARCRPGSRCRHPPHPRPGREGRHPPTPLSAMMCSSPSAWSSATSLVSSVTTACPGEREVHDDLRAQRLGEVAVPLTVLPGGPGRSVASSMSSTAHAERDRAAGSSAGRGVGRTTADRQGRAADRHHEAVTSAAVAPAVTRFIGGEPMNPATKRLGGPRSRLAAGCLPAGWSRCS